MRVGSVFLICLIAISRCLMLHSSNLYFDLDPAITNELPSGVLGPSSSVLLDAMILALCSIALLGETMRGRKIHWKFVCLAAFPMIGIWYQGLSDPMQYVHGSAWAAAIMASVTLAHLCRGQRVFLLAPIVLLAITIPLLASAAFAYGDHLQLVRYFEDHTQEVLGMNGLQMGTPAAAVYEERLRSFGPMGWFTTPNVFAGVVISLGVIWVFVGATVFRNKNKTYFLVASLLALFCCIAAIATLSKTAIVLVVLAGILSVGVYKTKTNTILKKWGGWIAISLVVASVYVVFFRGCLVDSALEERSLLVRSQYFVGGLEIAATHLLGVGPTQIQDAWLGVRPESATEIISSTHNIVIDWLVSYGILAICWIAILVKLLWNAGKHLWISDRSNKRQVFTAGIALSAIILVVDSQVDLAMFDLGSVLVVCCFLGIGGTFSNEQVKTRWIDLYTSILPFAMACVFLYFGYAPIAHDEALQRDAATSIIAGVPIDEVAATLADNSVTRQSKLIAAKLFMSAGNNEAALLSLENLEPNSEVWLMKSKAASTPKDAVFAAQKLVSIDPNGLQSALLLADAYWTNKENLEAYQAYNRVLQLNTKYQDDPPRTLMKSRVVLINQRLVKLR